MALLTTRIPPLYSPTPFPGHNPRPQPKSVQKAQIKSRRRQKDHHSRSDPDIPHNKEPTLVDRFFSLPLELRNKIYHYLLVRPNKFNLLHHTPCTTPLPYTRPGPSPTQEFRTFFYTSTNNCAACNPWPRVPQIHTFTSPARSSWATTPQLNPYLCDNCYWDVYGRYVGDPCLRSLPCLCARRTKLAILVVNKRFYEEAGPVFWGQNVWAFEHPCLLVGFLEVLTPRTRGWVRRICFMPIHSGIVVRDWPGDGDGDWVGDDDSRRVLGWGALKRCWHLLRLCEGLVELELDVVFLRKVEWALLIRMIRVKKVVVFSRHLGVEEVEERRGEDEKEAGWIWWSHANRVPVKTETTDLLVRSMMSDKACKSKTVKRHFAETSVMQRWGGDIYPDEA